MILHVGRMRKHSMPIWTYQMTQTKLRDILTKLFQIFYLQWALNILLLTRVSNDLNLY